MSVTIVRFSLNEKTKDVNRVDKLLSLAVLSLTLIRQKLLNSRYDPSF